METVVAAEAVPEDLEQLLEFQFQKQLIQYQLEEVADQIVEQDHLQQL